jgi:hypothetical protein
MMQLGTFEVRAMNWDDVRLESGVDGWKCHAGTVLIPVQVADGTIPTFSHCLASRDYLLVVRVQVQGLQYKCLSVRVPVQVCESVAEAKCDNSEAKSSVYGDMLLSEVSDILHGPCKESFVVVDYQLADHVSGATNIRRPPIQPGSMITVCCHKKPKSSRKEADSTTPCVTSPTFGRLAAKSVGRCLA